MNIKSIYDTIVLRAPCSHNTFLTHLDMSIRSLITNYQGSYVITTGEGYVPPKSVNDDVQVYEEYYSAIINNIMYLLTGDVNYKAYANIDGDSAYKAVWSQKVRGKKIRDRGYYNV